MTYTERIIALLMSIVFGVLIGVVSGSGSFAGLSLLGIFNTVMLVVLTSEKK